MALEAIINARSPHRIVLQEADYGVYVFVWDSETSRGPDKDYLQDDRLKAKEFCLEEYEIPLDSWQDIPDEELGSI